MKITLKFAILFYIISLSVSAQNYAERYRSINIKHYKLAIDLNDTNNSIDATISIDLQFRKNISSFYLDLVSLDSISGKGMKVDSIYQNNVPVEFKQKLNKLTIYPKHNFQNLTYTYIIKYSGIPNDGLIIGNNLHGDRTFFADNWPNRAQNWFPCVDHPSDKATIEYIVKAPNHYNIIANGELIEEIDLEENIKQTHWKTVVPLPTKVMVIGAAKFEIDSLGLTKKDNIPVTSWVYPQTKKEGFYDFGNTKEILDFYVELFGDYPYKKLANVQSSTKYGGMENASAIFYPEKSIFKNRMLQDRERVLKFYETTKTPIVDKRTTDYLKLLNPNTYQKGAWVLHMLRRELGDDLFYKGIKAYYEKYKFRNASTTSFKRVMAATSGKNLDLFFKQWLEKSGHPVIKIQWIYFNNKVRLMLEQTQENTFDSL